MYHRSESSLAELIQDPLVGLVMRSDGVDQRSIELLFETIAARRSAGSGVGSGQTEV
jgi:hypothetical protein